MTVIEQAQNEIEKLREIRADLEEQLAGFKSGHAKWLVGSPLVNATPERVKVLEKQIVDIDQTIAAFERLIEDERKGTV